MKACGRLIARMREQDVDCDIEADIELDSGIAVPVTSDPGDPAIKDRYLSPRQIGPDVGYKGIPQHDKGLQLSSVLYQDVTTTMGPILYI